jgi:hypothetical protein
MTNTLLQTIDLLKEYDKSLANWASRAPLMEDGKPIPVIWASPDRAFSTMQQVLNEGRFTEYQSESQTNIPLPFISIERSQFRFDPARYHGANALFRKLARSLDGKTYYQSRFPIPYDIDYTVNFWCKNNITSKNQLTQYCNLSFWEGNGFEMLLEVDFSELFESYGIKLIPFESEVIMDNSDLEVLGDGERVLRFTQSLTAKSWFQGTPTQVGAVLEVITDSYLTLGNQDISTVTAEQVYSDNEEKFIKIASYSYDEDGLERLQ